MFDFKNLSEAGYRAKYDYFKIIGSEYNRNGVYVYEELESYLYTRLFCSIIMLVVLAGCYALSYHWTEPVLVTVIILMIIAAVEWLICIRTMRLERGRVIIGYKGKKEMYAISSATVSFRDTYVGIIWTSIFGAVYIKRMGEKDFNKRYISCSNTGEIEALVCLINYLKDNKPETAESLTYEEFLTVYRKSCDMKG